MEIILVIATGAFLYSTFKINKRITRVESEIKMVWNRTEGRKWDL
jgi:hypothetical protein